MDRDGRGDGQWVSATSWPGAGRLADRATACRSKNVIFGSQI
jgi:hypothetical protein